MAKVNVKPVALAVSAALATSLGAMSAAHSADLFSVSSLSTGYMGDCMCEGKCGEGKCGAKDAEAKCGEGKCGGEKAKDAEGKCGEGKCGEGKCGEGKCGEGKCGAK